jgi:hypothetical protein
MVVGVRVNDRFSGIFSMITLDAVRIAVMGYARNGLHSQSHFTHNDSDTILSVVTVNQDTNISFVSLLVRILGETVIIERDQNDKPLVDALIQAGILRKHIVLAYAGETAPEATA